jgi:hypothetical protein
MDTSKHTPTPWRASDSVGPNMQSYTQSACVTGLGEHRMKIIAGCFSDIGGVDVAAANAAFIVKAVNSHEQLVAAARQALAECVDLVSTPAGDALEAALAAAGAA